MAAILLESMIQNLRQRLEAGTSHIDLTADVKSFVERMTEAEAWEAASRKFEGISTNAEKFVAMIQWLAAEDSDISFWRDYERLHKRTVQAHYEHFSSDTIYGALAKCILYAEYFRECARIQRVRSSRLPGYIVTVQRTDKDQSHV